MPRVDLVISNDRHHLAMVLPVARRLLQRPGYACRVLSLCELRGLPTPHAPLAAAGVEVTPVVTRAVRRSPAAGGGGRSSAARALARWAAWRLALAPRLSRLLAAPPALVVLPNDAAFPYDRIAALLRRRALPFLLLQEGARFPLPAAERGRVYGTGGAAAVAAWGAASGRYFASVGVPGERIVLTGSPRLDGIEEGDARPAARALAAELALDRPVLLLVTNPIDDQGFCSAAEKLALVGRFLADLQPLLAAGALQVVVKLHARERAADYERVAAAAGVAERTRIVTDAPLPALFELAAGVVILASTVGLEALRAGKPLGVLAIPGFGFVHDYVTSGAATGLDWQRPMSEQVRELIATDAATAAARAGAYLADHLAARDGAAEAVAGLVADLVEGRRER